MALGRGSPTAPASRPSLAWQLNEVYRQIAGAHTLQQTKFRWVLGAGLGGGASPRELLAHSRLFVPPQAAAQCREKVS